MEFLATGIRRITVVNNKASNNCPLVSSNKIPLSSIVLVNNLIDNTIVMPAFQLVRAEAGNERFNKDELNSNYTPKTALYK